MSERDQDQQDTDTDSDQPRGALTVPTRGGQVARRDFSGSSLTVQNPLTEALSAQARALVEARYIMALRRPRDIDDVRAIILAECKRPGFADVATYSRVVGKERIDEDGDPRGKKGEWVDVFADGLSIRFAEVALRSMGNMSCGALVIHDDDAVRMVQITAIDYESGGSWETVITIPKTVERKKLRKGQRPLGERENSYGDPVFIVRATDQEVHVKTQAEISKASRTAILRLVPGDIQDEAFELCRKIAATDGAKDPAAAKKRLIDGFAESGVRPSDIVVWLGHPIEQGTREEFLELSRICSGLREREVVWSEVLADRLAARASAKPAATAPAAPGAAATQATTSSSGPEPGKPEPTPAAAAFVATATAAPAAPAKGPTERAPRGAGGTRSDALKNAIGKNGGKATGAAPAKATEDPREAEPAWMAKSGDPERVIPSSELPPEERPADGCEFRRCATPGCTATIEVTHNAPAGAICYADTAANRDAE